MVNYLIQLDLQQLVSVEEDEYSFKLTFVMDCNLLDNTLDNTI